MTLRRAVIASTLCLAVSVSLSAQSAHRPWCAFEVLVNSPTGDPLSGIPVSASLNDGGRLLARAKSDKQGLARICDASPNSYVNIHVGEYSCAITVSEIYPLWLRTRRIVVVYQSCPAEEEGFSPYCHIVARVRDEHNGALSDVRLVVSGVSEEVARTLITDQFGRILHSIKWRESISGTLEKAGFVPERITLKCSPVQLTNEPIITLRASSPATDSPKP